MNKLFSTVLAIALIGFALAAQAQNSARPGFTADPDAPEGFPPQDAEDFADITLLPGAGWILTNQSNPIGSSGWFQGNPAVFSAQAGAASAYIAANFNNTAGTGQICNYLIMPDTGGTGSVRFWTRTVTGNVFPDRLRVLYSPTGGTTPGDCTSTDGDFSVELQSINDGLTVGGYPQNWTEFLVNVPAGAGGRLAFVYDVPNGGPFGDNSNYIGIDTVSTTDAATASATFEVRKAFNDGNTAEVNVTLSCNTGLPLVQDADISEGDPVRFVVVDFEDGTMDCQVTEEVPAGYSDSYASNGPDATVCAYEAVSQGNSFFCNITNSLDQVEIEVTKVWIDENPQFAAQNVADANWFCSNVAFGQNNGFLQFFGNPGEDSFFVFPDWESGTTCSIVEVGLNESGVEVDDSECDGLVVLPGEGASCTIFNTRLFEGIPTLSQYGLGVLALLMLGVGFVAFRRLI